MLFCKEKYCYRIAKYGTTKLKSWKLKSKHCEKHKTHTEYLIKDLKKYYNGVSEMTQSNNRFKVIFL